MKLLWSSTSPFVRKVWVMIKEKGIESLFEKQRSDPFSREDREASPNPLGQIPCLILEDGRAIYDSPVIMEYLDVVCDGPQMLPKSGSSRWTTLTRQALADGMMSSMVIYYLETLKKPERQSRGVLAHHKGTVLRGIGALNEELLLFSDQINVGTIAVAVAVAFAEQIYTEDWRNENANLADWFDEFSSRPSMRETVLTNS
ncbi:MAG: glutathione S-transferase N-terminal domain-containing protein [Pseudomonadota bacterium]|nr:glutathione S-transferase N-terminal domain-containing protein [Pseudomonadota bacterium]